MQEDNVMPNDGTFFYGKEPVDQVIGRKKEKAQTLEAMNVLKDLVARLEARIQFFESVTSIPDAVRTKPQEFLIMHNTHTLTAKSLQAEKEYIEQLLSDYAPNT